jgi:energy-coupling factor transporter ATP-binding protein EcfA2
LNYIFPQVEKAIEDLKWIKKARGVHRSLKKELAEITNKQKDLTSKLIGQGFKERFSIECSQLGLELPLQIDIRGSGAVTSKSFSVGLATQLMPDPSEVLSEGEQTAVALADFLTELELNKQPIGIIFDDPVNSMDHIRKKLIAKRLVEEATKRQVIIFTHDILFITSLADEAEKIGSEKIEFKGCTVSVDPNDKTPGYIDRTVFPNEYYEGNLKEQAEAYLKQAKQLAGKEQSEKLILGCGALRAAYENFIQKQMFGDVVARWRENIRATALPQIYYRQAVNDSVAERYEYLSRYEQGHSHSLEYHEVPLDCTVLESEIREFDKITHEYKKNADKFRKEKSEKKKNVFS